MIRQWRDDPRRRPRRISPDIAWFSGYGRIVSVEFVLDTGLEGDLTIPLTLPAHLDAPRVAFGSVLMADGSDRRVAIHEVVINWDGEQRVVEAYALEGRPLLGSTILDGYHLDIDMTEGGDASVEPI